MCALYCTCSRLPATQGGGVCTTVCVTLPRPDCLKTINPFCSLVLIFCCTLRTLLVVCWCLQVDMWLHARWVWMSWIEGRHCVMWVPTLRMYVCACAPVSHVIIVFKQFCILHIQYSLAHIRTYSTCMHTDRHTVRKFMQSHTTPTKRRDRSSYSTHLRR